jgi:hypothetical protein
MTRKQLFLDVDGVLHPFHGAHARESDVTIFHRDCMNRLKRIVEETDCEIVLSSSWRNFLNTRNILHANLAEYGMTYRTWIEPDSFHSNLSPSAAKYTKIMSFVQVHHPEEWIVLDDEDLIALGSVDPTSLMAQLFMSRFVQTDPRKGLSDTDVEKAIHTLNNMNDDNIGNYTSSRMSYYIIRSECNIKRILRINLGTLEMQVLLS